MSKPATDPPETISEGNTKYILKSIGGPLKHYEPETLPAGCELVEVKRKGNPGEPGVGDILMVAPLSHRWHVYVDTNSEKLFFRNAATKTVAWVLPSGERSEATRKDPDAEVETRRREKSPIQSSIAQRIAERAAVRRAAASSPTPSNRETNVEGNSAPSPIQTSISQRIAERAAARRAQAASPTPSVQDENAEVRDILQRGTESSAANSTDASPTDPRAAIRAQLQAKIQARLRTSQSPSPTVAKNIESSPVGQPKVSEPELPPPAAAVAKTEESPTTKPDVSRSVPGKRLGWRERLQKQRGESAADSAVPSRGPSVDSTQVRIEDARPVANRPASPAPAAALSSALDAVLGGKSPLRLRETTDNGDPVRNYDPVASAPTAVVVSSASQLERISKSGEIGARRAGPNEPLLSAGSRGAPSLASAAVVGAAAEHLESMTSAAAEGTSGIHRDVRDADEQVRQERAAAKRAELAAAERQRIAAEAAAARQEELAAAVARREEIEAQRVVLERERLVRIETAAKAERAASHAGVAPDGSGDIIDNQEQEVPEGAPPSFAAAVRATKAAADREIGAVREFTEATATAMMDALASGGGPSHADDVDDSLADPAVGAAELEKRRIQFTAASKYEGNVRKGTDIRQGKGRYTYNDAAVKAGQQEQFYEGQWSGDKKQGRGTLSLRGVVYNGQWESNRPHGKGTIQGRAVRASAAFVRGVPHGNAVVEAQGGLRFGGLLKSGVPSSPGALTMRGPHPGDGKHHVEWNWADPDSPGTGSVLVKFPNGDEYAGAVRAHRFHGAGRFRFAATGDEYSGEFAVGAMTGRGVYRFYRDAETVEKEAQEANANLEEARAVGGGVYEGDLVDGLFHGTGRHVSPDGFVYDGDWRHGQRHGRGTVTYDNGDVWEGLFEEDQRIRGRYVFSKCFVLNAPPPPNVASEYTQSHRALPKHLR